MALVLCQSDENSQTANTNDILSINLAETIAIACLRYFSPCVVKTLNSEVHNKLGQMCVVMVFRARTCVLDDILSSCIK